jgi:hypothetical protein
MMRSNRLHRHHPSTALPLPPPPKIPTDCDFFPSQAIPGAVFQVASPGLRRIRVTGPDGVAIELRVPNGSREDQARPRGQDMPGSSSSSIIEGEGARSFR